ncbi:MAG: PilZ domain-containing protein [Terriglobales bacterium]
MSHNNRTDENGSLKDSARPKASKKLELQYSDMQSAMRFPIRLPIAVKSQSGESRTESQNISANGVLFQMDSDMPIGSSVDFTILLPAEIVGAKADVQLDCRGRVVRSSDDGGRRGVGVVIDEYHFGRR